MKAGTPEAMPEAPSNAMPGAQTSRLDKWLWHARVTRSRSQATALVESGKVRVNRDKCRTPAKTVRPGDVLTINVGTRTLVWKILAISERRGAYAQARLLYEDMSPQIESEAQNPSAVRRSGDFFVLDD